MMKSFNEITDEICAKVAETLKKKNHDYGDSFYNQLLKHGDIASLLRMEEKMDRFNSLISKQAEVKESIEDTLLDLAGYAVLTLVTHERITQMGG